MRKFNCLTIFIFLWTETLSHDLKGFDDTTLFTLNWPGLPTENTENIIEQNQNDETEYLYVTSHAKEKYKCSIPKLSPKEFNQDTVYTGPNVIELLEPMFTGDVCSYRIESYWTYEICHGNYIKQYHEERDGKSSKLQEYYLGRWTKKMTEDLKKQLEENKEEKLKYKKIDGTNLPYFEIEMRDGTICDLNEEPRVTRVLYICYTHGKNEVYSIKETSSCNYEIIVLTPALCLHPKYKIQESTENAIDCTPVDGAPKKPKSLLAMEVESMKLRYQKLVDVNKSLKEAVAIFKVNEKDGKLTMELVENDFTNANIDFSSDVLDKNSKSVKITNNIHDTSPVDDFLEGKHCLTGGTGWWKYEFCYGRYVRQFHIDKNGENSIILGIFKENLHKEFLENHPEKRPKLKSSRKQITHFYAEGSFCEKTGKQRQTEVVLKCLENAASPSTVSLYLLEPKTCNYILGVESPLICKILDKVDEDALIPAKIDNKDEATSSAFILDDDIRFQNN